MTVDEFVMACDKARKENKNDWWVVIDHVDQKLISVKGYGTWVQRLETPEWVDGGPADCTVGVFKEYLTSSLESM